MIHDQLFYHLRDFYGSSVTLVEEIAGNIDFSNNTSTASRVETVLEAVVLPLKVCSEYFKGLVSHNQKYELVFFFETTENLKGKTFHIIYSSDRYNVKEVVILGPEHYLVVTTAQMGESND